MILLQFFKTEDSVAPFILRISLGVVVFPHGHQKIFDFSHVMDHLTVGYGLPWIIGLLIVIIEFFAPLFLVAGFASRLMAFLIGSVMAGAIPFHWENGFFMNWFGTQTGEGFEYHLLATGIAIALVFAGGGKFSMDSTLCKKRKGPVLLK